RSPQRNEPASLLAVSSDEPPQPPQPGFLALHSLVSPLLNDVGELVEVAKERPEPHPLGVPGGQRDEGSPAEPVFELRDWADAAPQSPAEGCSTQRHPHVNRIRLVDAPRLARR